MKKYLSAVLAVMVIAGIYGCGDNKTKEKLLGTAVYSGTGSSDSSGTSAKAADSASSAVIAAKMGVAMGSAFGSPTAPRHRATRRIPGGGGGENPLYNSGTGFFTYSYGGSTIQFRFLDSSGNPLPPLDGVNIYTIELASVSKINLKMTSHGANINLTMDIADIGQPMDGEITITVNGMTSTCTMTDLLVNESGTIVSGQISVVANGLTVALTFNNGAASGTISGYGYTATIEMDANGNGTYTDSEGRHTI